MTNDKQIMAYLADRDEQRRTAVRDTWHALTPRERRLVREVSVMAYVNGSNARRCGIDKIPPDSAIVSQAIDGCLQNDDLYPVIAHVREQAPPSRTGVRFTVHT